MALATRRLMRSHINSFSCVVTWIILRTSIPGLEQRITPEDVGRATIVATPVCFLIHRINRSNYIGKILHCRPCTNALTKGGASSTVNLVTIEGVRERDAGTNSAVFRATSPTLLCT